MIVLLLACVPEPPASFGDPAQLQPLEADNLAPEADLDGPLTLASGERDGIYWAHAKARLSDPPVEVWRALRTLDVVADRRGVDEYSWTDNVRPEFDFSFDMLNVVRNPIRVEYTLTWVHELHSGEIDAPERVVVRWDKTDGTPFIQQLGGSILLEADGAGTSLEFQEVLEAAQRDEQTLETFLADVLDDVVSTLDGAPLTEH